MTLDKHQLDGIDQITEKTLPAEKFEKLLLDAGYQRLGGSDRRRNQKVSGMMYQ